MTTYENGQMVVHETPGVYVLGNDFLQNYYTIFDVDNQRVGLVPSIHSSSEVDITTDTLKWKSSTYETTLFVWIVIIFWAIIIRVNYKQAKEMSMEQPAMQQN